jgi:predicted ester cyclase
MTTTANTAADTTAGDTVAVTETNRSRPRELTDRERRNEATMRRIYAEIFDQGQLELIEQLMAPDAVNHTAPEGFQHGTDPVRGLVSMLRTAFPDCATVIEETLPVDDTVVMRNWFEGTHLGEFRGHRPTGRRFRFRQIHWMRFGSDGRVVEHWGVRDDITHLQQLGLIPS